MLRGIDVSSHQSDIAVDTMPIDFVIAKATEGIGYVNPWCDPIVEKCKRSGKLWGFYHYARENSPVDEADFFIENCENYFGQAIPVLDWEENQSVGWVNEFVKRIHDKTSIWPWIYANPWRFNDGGVEPNCARWIASYPNRLVHPTLDVDPGEPPQTDGLVACWQYASDGIVPGYSGDLDVNHFFGSREAWCAYSGIAPDLENKPTSQSVLENEDYRVEITRKS